MQNTSQEAAEKSRTKGPARSPEEGNMLWKLYKELGHTDREAFWAHLAAVPIHQTTFSKATKPGRTMGSLLTTHFMAYRVFFLEHGGHDLMEDFLNELPDAAPYQALAL